MNSVSAIEIRSYRRILAGIAVLLILPWIFSLPFASKGEPREALVAKAMLETGNWVLPQRYGDDFATKPPMLHWMVALVSAPLGAVTETSSRVPSAALSILGILSLFGYLAQRGEAQRGFITGMLLLGSFEWYQSSLSCRVDMALSVFLLFGFLSLLCWEEKNCEGVPLAAILSFSAATLTKGPVALVLPGAVCGAYLLVRGKSFAATLYAALMVFLPAALLAATWYLAAYQQHGQDFLRTVLAENFSRFTSADDASGGHEHSVLYLLGVFILGLLPWSAAVFPVAVKELWRRKFEGWKSWFAGLKKEEQFCWIVTAAWLIFFSIPASKRGVYLLPAYPFVCVLMAGWVQANLRSQSAVFSKFCLGFSGFVFIVYWTLGLCFSGLIRPEWFSKKPATVQEAAFYLEVIRGVFSGEKFFMLLIFLLPMIFVALAWRKNSSVTEYATHGFGLYASLLILVQYAFIPRIQQELSGKDFARVVSEYVAEEPLLYSYKMKFYTLDFYLPQKIKALTNPEQLSYGKYCLVLESDLEALRKAAGPYLDYEEVARSENGIEKPKYITLLTRVMPKIN